VVDVIIRRKPVYEEGLRYLPIHKNERDQFASYLARIQEMVNNKRKIFVEDIRDLVKEVSEV